MFFFSFKFLRRSNFPPLRKSFCWPSARMSISGIEELQEEFQTPLGTWRREHRFGTGWVKEGAFRSFPQGDLGKKKRDV